MSKDLSQSTNTPSGQGPASQDTGSAAPLASWDKRLFGYGTQAYAIYLVGPQWVRAVERWIADGGSWHPPVLLSALLAMIWAPMGVDRLVDLGKVIASKLPFGKG